MYRNLNTEIYLKYKTQKIKQSSLKPNKTYYIQYVSEELSFQIFRNVLFIKLCKKDTKKSQDLDITSFTFGNLC